MGVIRGMGEDADKAGLDAKNRDDMSREEFIDIGVLFIGGSQLDEGCN